MRPVFLDTSGWFAAMSAAERAHAAARSAYDKAVKSPGRFVTTTLVLAEMQVLLLRARGAPDAAEFIDAALASTSIRVVDPSVDLVGAAAARWLRGFRDQRFSLCDAVSFEVMRRERLTHAVALDRHFRIAGYSILA